MDWTFKDHQKIKRTISQDHLKKEKKVWLLGINSEEMRGGPLLHSAVYLCSWSFACARYCLIVGFMCLCVVGVYV